ncbi:MAG TPA: rhomboid family intramembrane serine protease, partial [Xanthomonadaceae bacterium]|nr:rhomboid family intramembrane serine protease [Xanthomonadaceae bacterium]
AFTPSHALGFKDFEPGRMLWGMFMHGSMEHIVGNMIFLAILGMLVEGALGPWWFLGLYFAGGIGAAFTTLAWHWGEEGITLGASGAIAALMGAYCVIWGLRKVRVFYWFFVVFDYVKLPALVMLPFWFCALVLYPWLIHDNTDFADHFGGIVSGAAFAFVLRRQGLVQHAFIDEDERVEKNEHNEAAFEQASQLLGRLEIPKAREILIRIDKVEPGQLRVMVALYRCARFAGKTNELDAAILRVLGFATTAEADIRQIQATYQDYSKACGGAPRLAPELLLGLLPSWTRHGDDAAAESLLRDVSAVRPTEQGLPAAWFALALRAPEGSNKRRQLLAYLLEHHAQSDFAPKARFLLSQD